jgi:SPP1 gp7 family putative phage head morphogenesis protein
MTQNDESQLAGGADSTLPTQAKPKSGKSQNLVSELYTGIAEATFYRSSYWAESFQAPYNPDDIFRLSNDYSIYEDMLNDDQVDVCLQIKRDLVVGSGWDIVPSVTDGSQDEIKKDLEIALEEDPEHPIDDLIDEILFSGYGYGFALSEKLFKYRDDNTLTLRNIKTRHPSTWLIHTDEQGNVQKYVQHGPKGDITVDPKSLIHYRNSQRFGNVYGRSDLRAAYNAWFIKRQVIKWYAIFLEKAASPVPVAKYDKNAPQTAVDTIHSAIKSFQAKTSLTIPKDIEIEFLESKSAGEAYEKGINIFNMFIGRCLMIPDLLGFQGSETGGGSYALGKDQLGVLFKHIERRRVSIERIVNKHIVFPIVVTNHGLLEDYPKFKLRPISDEHVVELAKLWIQLASGKLYKPSDEEINHFRAIAKFPQGDVEREAPPPMPGQNPGADNENPMEDAQEGGSEADDSSKPNSDGVSGGASKKENSNPSEKKYAAKALPGDYDKKVDYTAIKSSMDSFKSKVVDAALPIVQRIFDDLYEQIKTKKIIQNQDPARLDSLKLKSPKDLNLLLKRSLRDGFKEAMATGRKELLKGVFRAPLPDDKFLEFLDQETFQYIGDWSYNITKDVRVKIMAAIKDGKPLSAIIDILDSEGIDDAMVSIERYARTKFTDVMNRGRMAAFNDSGVVVAYQYSAILDDRTTDICAGLHGKIFEQADAPIPPLHFNCRSLLVPITKYESYEADDSVDGEPIDKFIEDNKGDGFAKFTLKR